MLTVQFPSLHVMTIAGGLPIRKRSEQVKSIAIIPNQTNSIRGEQHHTLNREHQPDVTFSRDERESTGVPSTGVVSYYPGDRQHYRSATNMALDQGRGESDGETTGRVMLTCSFSVLFRVFRICACAKHGFQWKIW